MNENTKSNRIHNNTWIYPYWTVRKHEKLYKPRMRKHEKLHTRTAQKTPTNIVYYKGAREPLTKSLNVRVNAEDYQAKKHYSTTVLPGITDLTITYITGINAFITVIQSLDSHTAKCGS